MARVLYNVMAVLGTLILFNCNYNNRSDVNSERKGTAATKNSRAKEGEDDSMEHFCFFPPVMNNPAFTGVFNDTLKPVAGIGPVGDSDAVSGTSGEPKVYVTGKNIAIASGDNTPAVSDGTDFGRCVMKTGYVTRTFTIRNSGSAALHLSGIPKIAVTGAHAGDFSVMVQPSSPVPVNGITVFTITFSPQSGGPRTASVMIKSDDADESEFTFGIRGTGTRGMAEIGF